MSTYEPSDEVVKAVRLAADVTHHQAVHAIAAAYPAIRAEVLGPVQRVATKVLAAHRWEGAWGDNDGPVTGRYFRCSCGWTHRVDGMNGWWSWMSRHDEHVAEQLTALLSDPAPVHPDTARLAAVAALAEADPTKSFVKVSDVRDAIGDPDAVARNGPACGACSPDRHPEATS